jgi:phosphoribosyl 1,2-cyclic phosphodiesterase
MHLQILASGSEGNSTLIRAGETNLLVDAGLSKADMEARLEGARLPTGALDHVVVTHGHLDHARSSGAIARRERATLHCAESMMRHASARRSPRLAAITIDRPFEVESKRGGDTVQLTPVGLPHDCDPTVAYRVEHAGRVAVILTDMGSPNDQVAERLAGAHVLVLEFNYDPELMRAGPYPAMLQRRITGSRGHLSNEQAGSMLERLASSALHTLVLAHLSLKTNRPELALEVAVKTLERLGLGHVRVLVASQHESGPSLEV